MAWADRRHRNPVDKPDGQELGHPHVLQPSEPGLWCYYTQTCQTLP